MSTPPLPSGLPDTYVHRVANQLHSAAIHFLRQTRTVDLAAGLTPERLSLLSVLAYVGPRTVGELASIEMISRPAISRTLNALETSGLARRERQEGDRRQVRAFATPKGRRLIETGRQRRLEHIAERLSALTEDELRVLAAASEILDSLGARP